MKTIRVMLADASEESRESMLSLLEADNDIDVIYETSRGSELLEMLPRHDPEVIIVDLNITDQSAFEVCHEVNVHYPGVEVIMVSDRDDIKLLKKAMQAGARELLVKPLEGHDVIPLIKEIADTARRRTQALGEKPRSASAPVSPKAEEFLKPSRLITVFGNKGGVGKSIIATNLAVAASQKHPGSVSLVDLDVQFGDISLMMNINPRKTIAELMQESGELTSDLMDEYFYERSGVKILAAPNKPELGELVTSFGVETVLKICRELYRYTIIDTPTFLDETTLTALEMSDVVLLLISLDIPTIKNIKKGIDILESLKLLPRTKLILNRSASLSVGLEPQDVEQVLGMKITTSIPSDYKVTVSSVNRGTPFMTMSPKSPISRSMIDLFNIIEK